jgi:hypothetical protein
MGRVVSKQACPRCRENGRDRSGDNLAVYEDGSAYCFSCGYTKSRTGLVYRKKDNHKHYALPSDLTWEMPVNVQKWLYKYLDRNDIIKYRIGYSPYWDQIVIPIGLNGYLSRNFNKDKPKWYFRGDKPTDYIIGDSDKVILCEDILSGIKIAKAGYAAHILFGTNIPVEVSRTLYKRFSTIKVWLDMDAQKKSLRSVLRLQQFFRNVGTISTQHDPKEYDVDQIKEIIK